MTADLAHTDWAPGQTAMPLPPTVATSVSGFCQFALHARCSGAAGDPCSCRCHAGEELAVSRNRTSPPRDLSAEVNAHGLVSVDVLVGGRRTACNLPPATAAQFLRELADDLDRIPTPTPCDDGDTDE